MLFGVQSHYIFYDRLFIGTFEDLVAMHKQQVQRVCRF